MLKAALTHPKMHDLCARLGCSRREAIGILELLWDFTGDFAIQGNIGKQTDGAIARACDWPGDPAAFIAALVDSGWLDRDPTHRLLIHDWPEHCHRWVKSKLSRSNLPFLTTVVPTTLGTVVATSSQAKPSQAKSKEGHSLPRDFELDMDRRGYANSLGLYAAGEFAQFRDYHLARGSTFRDWDAAWRTWCRKAVQFGSKPPPADPKTEASNRDRLAGLIGGVKRIPK